MKLLKKSALDILMPQTSQTDCIISVCLLDIKEMAGNLLQQAVANKPKQWRLFPKYFQLQIQEKFKRLVKPPKYCSKDLDGKTADDKETMRLFGKFAAINSQTQPTDTYLEKQQTTTTPETTNNPDWTKANIVDFPAYNKLQPNYYSRKNALTGQSILCVGGRAALYPAYHRLIASLGARLLIYRGSLKNNMNQLYTSLVSADMVICPVDCVNHNDFFAVKFYCKFSGKPYTLLDRSNLATFNKGVKTLARLACQHNCKPSGYS
jgi:hypothetical protein